MLRTTVVAVLLLASFGFWEAAALRSKFFKTKPRLKKYEDALRSFRNRLQVFCNSNCS